MVTETEAQEARSRSIEQEPSTSAIMGGLADLKSTLDKATKTIRPPEKSIFELLTSRQAVHVKMRVYDIVLNFTHTAAATLTLTIGNKTYLFPIAANGGLSGGMPFPIILDRGVDVFITASAGTLGACWLTYTPEE